MAGERKRKTKQVPKQESRWRTARLTIRLHPDLRDAAKFLAKQDNRTLANWVETEIISTARKRLENKFAATGERLDDHDEPLTLRGGQ
jgi:hypothetical protein